jgi:HK97 family phage major capsid protein
MSKLIEVRERMAALMKQQVEVAEQYPDYDLPEEKLAEVTQRNNELNDLKDQYKKLQETESMLGAAKAGHEEMTKPAGRMVHPTNESELGERKGGRILPIRRSLGDQVLNHDEWKAWATYTAPNGHFSDRKQIQSPAIPIDMKALVTGASDTSGGAFIFNDVQPGLVELGRRPLSIRSVITNGTTNSDTVEFVRVTSETNNAATVAEATATSGGVGIKPESALALEKVTTAVKTIAHWIPATTRALADAGQMRTLIDNFLIYGLEEELEDQIVNGDGTGENLTGISNTTGVQAQAWDTDLLTTTRKARTKVRVVGRAVPTAYLLHPNDWERLDLLQDNEARYYFGGPMVMGSPRLWSLPVVESEAVTEGVGYVGDFRTAVLWDREQANIQVSNSHSDFFIRNMVAILAEMRAAFGVLRPTAIVEMDLTA